MIEVAVPSFYPKLFWVPSIVEPLGVIENFG